MRINGAQRKRMSVRIRLENVHIISVDPDVY